MGDLPDNLLDWLLEEANPSARYLALTEMLERPPDDAEVMTARQAIPGADPARSILDAQFPASTSASGPGGYWVKPDVGYSPKYRATVWQVLFLAQLGAPPVEPVQRACEYVLNHSRRTSDQQGHPDGRFVAGSRPQNAIDCLNGNLLWALSRLGYADDPRAVQAREATAQVILRRGFACHYNGQLPCAWGDVKALRAFLDLPEERRSAAVAGAIQRGIEFLLSVPLLEASYPTRTQASHDWFKLSFPLDYRADLAEAITVLGQAGYGDLPSVRAGVEWLLARQGAAGRWALERVPGKMWASFGRVGQPNKWVTLRALCALKAVE